MSTDNLNRIMKDLKIQAERWAERMTKNCVIVEDEKDAVSESKVLYGDGPRRQSSLSGMCSGLREDGGHAGVLDVYSLWVP